MERTLTNFIRALRSAGSTVSSAEAIDAARTLALVGFEDRQRLKDCLGVVLAKSEDEKSLHDQMFETYFSRAASEAQAQKEAERHLQEQSDQQDSVEQKGQAPLNDRHNPQAHAAQPPGDASGANPGQNGKVESGAENFYESSENSQASAGAFMELAQSGDANRIAVAIERAGSQVAVEEIRFATQRPYFTRRILEQLGVRGLETQLTQRMDQSTSQARAQVLAMTQARSILQRQARAYVEKKFELFGKSATEAFMDEIVVNREINQLGLRDMERMKALVAKMAKRLAVRHSRRRRVRNRGQLDIRHTMRANAGYDGIPVELVWKHKRKDRPKIVAICDVSGSVSQYVRFLLLFLYLLKDEVADLGAFAFSAKLKDVAETLDSMSFEKAFARIMLEVGSGGTDYGQALVELKQNYWEVIDRRTTIIILGDGRSNNADPRLDIFQEAVDRAKRVVWLSPEPQARWGTGDSCMLQYQPHCNHMSYCATALDLERALDEVLQAYD